MKNSYSIKQRINLFLRSVLIFLLCLSSAHSFAQGILTIQTTNPYVSNCYPFGSNQQGFSGFIYRNIPAFTLNVGDKIRFDMGGINNVDTRRNIYFSAANINPSVWNGASQGVNAVGWTKVVADDQIPLNPRGNTIIGDFELTYVATSSFTFGGGGFIIGFGGSSPGPYVDNGCEQVGVCTTSSDPSGYFYKRFYGVSNLQTTTLDNGGDPQELQGFKIEPNAASGLNFDGVNDYVTTPAVSDMDFGTSTNLPSSHGLN